MAGKKHFVWPLLAALAIGGGSYFGSVEFGHGNAAVAAAPLESARPTPEPRSDTVAPATDLSRAFRAVHNSLKDAVVNINVVKKAAPSGRRIQIPQELRDQLPPGFDDQQQDPEMRGTGSGVIVSADGYILTNNHVVGGADDVQVTLNDGRELKAEVMGTDPKTDLAVVHIKADHLTFAKFGDSDALDVGDWVLAFGSPFGFSQTMTQGIISAKSRHIPIIAAHDPNLQGMTYENFLQTDAAINPGNSGGPLVNLKGEVVGINAAIASDTGAYNGIGFSIPSNDAQYVMKSLIEHGKVVRGYLGIGIDDINHPQTKYQALANAIRKDGFKDAHGTLVSEVYDDTPGAAAGLRQGDVITAIDGKIYDSVDDLRNQIARIAPDSKVKLSIFRDGKTQTLNATVGMQPDTNKAVILASHKTVAGEAAASTDLGIGVEDMTANQAKGYNLTGGVMVTKVAPKGVAAEMGLKLGDVVTRVGKTTINSTKDFTEAMKSVNLSDGVKLTVRTEDGMDRLVYIEKK